MDEDDLWFLHGRADDALNVAGEKLSKPLQSGEVLLVDAFPKTQSGKII